MAKYSRLIKEIDETINSFCAYRSRGYGAKARRQELDTLRTCLNALREYSVIRLVDVEKAIELNMAPDVKMSAKRQASLVEAFPTITWDFQNVKLFDYGQYGDRISFAIPGRYKEVKVTYIHRTPGGAAARLHVFKNGKKKSIWPAPFCKAEEVMVKLDSFIAQ